MFGIAASWQDREPGETDSSTLPHPPTSHPHPLSLPKGWASPPSQPWDHLTALSWINVASVSSSVLLIGFDGGGREMRKPWVLLVVGGPCSPHQGQFPFGRVKYERPRHPVVSECYTQHVISRAQAERQCHAGLCMDRGTGLLSVAG